MQVVVQLVVVIKTLVLVVGRSTKRVDRENEYTIQNSATGSRLTCS